jgi:hypothetical protein
MRTLAKEYGGTYRPASPSDEMHQVHFERYEFLISFDRNGRLIGFNEMKAIEILGWYLPLGFDFPLECQKDNR